MKSYLSKFLTDTTRGPKSLENSLEPNQQNQQKLAPILDKSTETEPAKPAEGGSAGFAGSISDAFPKIQPDLPEAESPGAQEIGSRQNHQKPAQTFEDSLSNTRRPDSSACPVCQGPLGEQIGKTFVHRWCLTPGHFDSWRADGGRRLSDTDASIIRGER